VPLDEEVRGDGREPVGRAETLEEADGRRRLGELLKDVPAAEAARHVGITRATPRGEFRRRRGNGFSRANLRPDSVIDKWGE